MGWHTALRVMVLPVVLPVNRLPPMPLGRDRSLTVLFVHSRERYRRMRIGSARSHFGCDPNRFHNFLLRSAMPQRGFCVALNAVWRLSHVRDGNRNELFGLSGCRRARDSVSILHSGPHKNRAAALRYAAGNCGSDLETE